MVLGPRFLVRDGPWSFVRSGCWTYRAMDAVRNRRSLRKTRTAVSLRLDLAHGGLGKAVCGLQLREDRR